MNPVTPEMLRDDWSDNQDLSEMDRQVLGQIDNETLQEALDCAFEGYEDMWYFVLDNTRSDATSALLRDLVKKGGP